MRLMMRWSPMSSVFSMEPEGMTRACPMVPLISRNTSPTQNQAITSRWIFVLIGTFTSVFFAFSVFALSAFTMHHHRPFCGSRLTIYCNRSGGRIFLGTAPANLQLYQVGRINACVTRRTESTFGVGDGLFERGKREVAERIRAEEFADLFGRLRGGNQFLACGRVHDVVAGRDGGRATDAHVDFLGSGVANHTHDFAAGGAADDGIVHEHDALAFNEAANRIELELDAEIADRLRRLDERAADVMIADQAHAEGNFGFERIADGSGHAGVGHGNHNVRFGGMFAREQAAEHFAALVDGAAENDAVRTREIDVLENALLMLLRGREVDGLDAAFRDAHHFTGLDFADVLRVQQVERAGFRSHEPGKGATRRQKLAEGQRAEAARVTHGVQLVAGKNEERIGAFDLIQCVAERARKIAGLRAREQMHDDFRIAVRLKDRAAMLKLAAPLGGVGQIAVVTERNLALVAVDHNGLGVQQRFVAGRGIPRVADGQAAGQLRENAGLENLFNFAHGAMVLEFQAVACDDAGGFLTAMLEGIKAEVNQIRGFGMAKNAEDATMVVEVVVRETEKVAHSSAVLLVERIDGVNRNAKNNKPTRAMDRALTAGVRPEPKIAPVNPLVSAYPRTMKDGPRNPCLASARPSAAAKQQAASVASEATARNRRAVARRSFIYGYPATARASWPRRRAKFRRWTRQRRTPAVRCGRHRRG